MLETPCRVVVKSKGNIPLCAMNKFRGRLPVAKRKKNPPAKLHEHEVLKLGTKSIKIYAHELVKK